MAIECLHFIIPEGKYSKIDFLPLRFIHLSMPYRFGLPFQT